jgi:O-antigen/teichoic acid export membrane protein
LYNPVEIGEEEHSIGHGSNFQRQKCLTASQVFSGHHTGQRCWHCRYVSEQPYLSLYAGAFWCGAGCHSDLDPNHRDRPVKLGLHSAGLYYLGQQKYADVEIVSSVVWMGVAIGLLLLGAGLAGMSILTRLIPEAPTTPILLALAAILPQVLLLYFGDIAIGLGKTSTAVLMRILPGAGYLILSLGLVVLSRLGVTGAMIAYLAGMWGAATAGFVSLSRSGAIRLTVSWPFVKEALRFGFQSHIGDIAQYLVYRLDLPLVSYYAGLSAAGYYSVAVRIAELLWLPSNSLRAVLLAHVSSSQNTDADRLTALLSRVLLVFSVLAAILLGAAGQLLIGWILPQYLPAVPLLWILLPGVVTASVFRVLIGDITGRGTPGRVAQITVGGLLAGLALYLVLIPRLGAMGAALTSSVLYFGEYIVVLIVLASRSKMPVRDFVLIRRQDLSVLMGIARRNASSVTAALKGSWIHVGNTRR